MNQGLNVKCCYIASWPLATYTQCYVVPLLSHAKIMKCKTLIHEMNSIKISTIIYSNCSKAMLSSH